MNFCHIDPKFPTMLILLLILFAAHAQAINTIEGVITDIETDQPVEGAIVLIPGTSLQDVTDEQGHYSLKDLPDGIYDIEVYHNAYCTKTNRKISVEAGEIKKVDFRISAKVFKMPEIIIRSERIEQTRRKTTATVNVLSSEDISKGSASTFDQALETVPGVMLNRSAGTATNCVSIRGSSETLGGGVGNRVLLLIDGRPAITADTGGANWSMLPMDVIERVEVVKGALSPLYGSNAMGGVVNFITMSPAESRHTKLSLGGGYFEKPPELMRYTDQRNYFGDASVVYSDTHNSLGYVLNLNGKKSDGYRQNTDFSLYNAYGKLQYNSDDDLRLNLSLGRTSLERGFPYIWLIDNIAPFVHPYNIAYTKTNDRQEKEIWDFDLSLKSPVTSSLDLSANIYHFGNYSRSLFNPDNLTGDDQAYGFFTDSDAKKSGGLVQIDISNLSRNYLILGLDAQMDSVNSNPPDLMFGKHRAETLACFAQDRITLSDDLIFMLGARCDYRHLEDTRDESQLSPKLGISYQVNNDTALRCSVGQAFRSPSLGEIYLREEIHSGVKFKENPDLKSEKLRAYAEFGVRHRLLDSLKTDTAVFIYDFSDMILWESLGDNMFQVTNLNRSVISGLETSLEFLWQGLSANATYTYLDARDKTEGRTDDKLPYKPKHTAYAALNYQYSRLALNLSLRYVSEVEEAIFYPNDAPDAFYIVNSRLSCNLSDQITLSVIVNNLLNRQYEEMARYRMPGRSIAFRMTVDQY